MGGKRIFCTRKLRPRRWKTCPACPSDAVWTAGKDQGLWKQLDLPPTPPLGSCVTLGGSWPAMSLIGLFRKDLSGSRGDRDGGPAAGPETISP